jgi:hypothetical protein
MPTTQAKRRGPAPEEITKRQREDAEALRRQKVNVPAKVTATTPAPLTVDARTPEEVYADEICQTSVVGQLIKFDGKVGHYVVVETGEALDGKQFIAAIDETLGGYIRFNGEDQVPDRVQGLIYRGWIKPPRATLGDNDPSQWPAGLSGKPEDPWKEQVNLVLIDPATHAFFTFATTSKTGRSGIGALLQHYNRMRKNDPDSYPVVALTPSGYNDKRYGWVNKPVFAIVGRTPKNAATVPDTSVAKDMDDEIPF